MTIPRSTKALRILYRIRRELAQRFSKPRTLYVWQRVPYYRQLWQEACDLCGFTLVELKQDTWEVQRDGQQLTRINNCYLELDNPVTLDTAGNKPLTYQLLERHGLPVAAYRSFQLDDLAPMYDFIDAHSGPFVVKPGYGTGSGIGVTTHLRGRDSCRRAAVLASLHCPELLIEQHVPGEVYRLLYLGDRIIAASRRKGLWLTGDGAATLLMLYMSERPDDVEAAVWQQDPDFIHTIELQGLSLDQVVKGGERVLVKSVSAITDSMSEVRTVYDEDAFASLAPAIIADAERAAQTLRSEFCGIDIITPDPTRSLAEAGGVIGEVNTTPGLHHHHGLHRNAPHIGATVLQYIVEKQRF